VQQLWFAVLLVATLSGCQTHEIAGVDRASYTIFEDGQRKQFHVVNVATATLFLPAPAKLTIALLTDIPAKHDWLAIASVTRCPPWRQLGGAGTGSLFSIVKSLTQDVPDRYPRWILGNRPIVVAIGRDKLNPPEREFQESFLGSELFGERAVRIGCDQRLVNDEVMNQYADKLIVLDRWPIAEPRNDDAPPPADRRMTVLEQPLTIREVLERRLWETKRTLGQTTQIEAVMRSRIVPFPSRATTPPS
jgi:hypothetical protein